MTTATYPDFGAKTEAQTVAAAFASSIKCRTILITGVNKLGIGYATAQALASQSPRHLIITGRSQSKLQECLDGLQQEYPNVDVRTLLLDLSSQNFARKAAEELLSWNDVPVVDIVINNAGIMSIPERTLSEEGIELHFATNHIGHFLFTNLIMPKIIASTKISSSNGSATRIINVSSMATGVSPLRASDINWEKPTTQLPDSEKPNLTMMKMAAMDVNEEMSYIPMGAYGQSKTANILYSVALNERLHGKFGLLSLSLHPGEVLSELQRTVDKEWFDKTFEWKKKIGLEYKTRDQGASTALVAALDPKLGAPSSDGNGVFLNDCQISAKVPPYALDKAEAEKLWSLTEELVKEKFTW